MNRRAHVLLRRTLAAAIALLLQLAGGTTVAQQRGASERVELVMVDTPLDEVVNSIAKLTGNAYLYEPPLPGRVTVAVPSRVTPAEATEILNAALQIRGFVAVPIAAKRYKIARWEKMPGSAPFTEDELDEGAEGAITTRIELRYADPSEVARALGPLIQAKGQAIAYAPSGSLILAGTENRVKRLIEIARLLDEAEGEKLIVRRLRYRDANEVRSNLEAMVSRDARTGGRTVKLNALIDARTNALLLTGTPAQLDKWRDWIDIMDIPPAGEGELQVVHLIHQEPEELANLLNGLARSGPSRSSGRSNEADAGPLMGRDYSIVAHPATRSLVVRADRTTYDTIRELIGKLDREPRVVRVDVNIFEVTTSGDLGLGIGGIVPIIKPKDIDQTGLVAFVNPGLVPVDIPGLDFGDSPVGGVVAPTFQVAGESTVIPILDPDGFPILGPDGQPQFVAVPGLGIAMIAQHVSAEINVEQRPSILVEVGQEAELFVGDNIPIPVGSGTEFDINQGPTIGVTIQREDIGTKINIKPVFSNDGSLQLDLTLDLQLVRSAGGLGTGPILANRSVTTSFSADFGQRMIIAGLDSETVGKRSSGIPFLSAIPIIGSLFTATLDTKTKTYSLYAVQAHLIPTTEERQASEIAIARALKRIEARLKHEGQSRYALLAASYYKRSMAMAVEKTLDVSPWTTVISKRDSEDGVRFDLFVMGLDYMSDVAKTALTLERAGLRPEIVTLASGSDAVR